MLKIWLSQFIRVVTVTTGQTFMYIQSNPDPGVNSIK